MLTVHYQFTIFMQLKLIDITSFVFFRESTQQEVASIQLVNSTDGECAFSAVISAVSKSPHRKTSMVLAENKGESQKHLTLFSLNC